MPLAQGPASVRQVPGGVADSLGCVFILRDRRMPDSHRVWHLFVISASTCHVLARQALV